MSEAGPCPNLVDGVLTELGYRWADPGTRRRRTWAAALSSGVMVCLAAIAGSGLLLGDSHPERTLGTAIGRLGVGLAGGAGPDASLVTGSGVPPPQALVEEFAEALGRDRAENDPLESSSETPPEDPTLGILATAPWRPV